MRAIAPLEVARSHDGNFILNDLREGLAATDELGDVFFAEEDFGGFGVGVVVFGRHR